MTIRPAVSSRPLYLDNKWPTMPGSVDVFARPDGDIDGEWEDAADYWPTLFDRASIEDNEVRLYPTWPDTHTVDSDWTVGHVLAARETGLATNFEVGIEVIFDRFDDLLGQVAPCALIDLQSTHPLAMGVVAISDIGVAGWPTYMHNAFRTTTDPSDVLDPAAYYRGEDLETQGFLDFSSQPSPFPIVGQIEIKIRVVGDFMRMYWDGKARGSAPSPVPTWAAGRTMHGFHIVGQAQKLGEIDPDTSQPVTETAPDRLLRWWCRPYTGTLT